MTQNNLSKMILAAALAVTPAVFASNPASEIADAKLVNQIRKEIVTLPFYSLWDHFSYKVDDGVVTLMGQTVRPTLKTSAERVVARLEGVREVRNEIEVLPLSPFDDRIRLQTARAIYGNNVLSRYALGAVPRIHIVVRNGEVTLEGVVLNEGERNIANIVANGVSGVFKVNNNLRVENKS